MSGRRGMPTRVGALACVLLVGAVGCGGGGSRGESPVQPRPAPTTTAGGDAIEASPLEGQVELPIGAYAFSREELRVISSAENRLTGACMRKYGLGYRAGTAEGATEYQPGTNRRYGVLNPAVASRYGYHFPEPVSAPKPETLTEKELLALNGSPAGTAEVKGKQVPEGGCIGQSKARIRGKYTYAKGAEVAGSIATDSFTESMRSPEVVKATGAWARCMKEKGFSYASPMQAIGAEEFSGQDVTKREISVAEADVDCKLSTDLVRIWSAEESEIQKSLMKKSRKDLDRLASSHRKVLKEARSVTG
ncbi:hypothetical protein ACFUTV_18955 [Streptomyces sp. NPDC057298]|uniref:hypothetical protein n=1 Tax=Streptomyces sp. NPDC057298 TaxID=3346091 RepID=UPI0036339359